ncbi:UV radiation resistance protein and autophagy-related subunit 14-domain-containing protein [Pisolithus orientalis]|uniref:UV radiation resistance protein and autophagy-related subunit 14-domain-containing protein n=1 Tax=Pisolithus orientalis TaxID=936130 RepID=UPI00222456E7|nr:UV radiation resistance protein and autophagy-related subunit 14-domain-containing protein [Pisolithus orientalis]KAI6001569.1 UV radiation resistance protein and autophagy-related subunit 14-domain-containing protein [Pisolithus orientalis]
MECTNCELRQRQFYCENCLRNHLRDFRRQTQHFAKDRDEQVSRATRALRSVEGARVSRAVFAAAQRRAEELAEALGQLRRENEAKRDRVRLMRESVAARRRTLSAARLLSTPPLDGALTRETQALHVLSNALARARGGLVQELVEVFSVVEVGGRPALGGRAGTRGEWTVGGLVLPVPGDIQRYPSDHINAVLTYTIHFVGLLAFYLGVKLPFEITWSGGRFGVGQPWIGAGRGGESGSWAKWSTKHPLHLSAPGSTRPSSPSSPTVQPSTHYPSTSASASSVMSVSTTPVSASGSQPQSSFTTAFAMLLYNVCYLAHTQGVEIPLSQAGDALSNLWAVCCSGELGRRSHATTPLLSPPTPSSFPLDFAQLLQATTAVPTRGRRRRPMPGNSPVDTSSYSPGTPTDDRDWGVLPSRHHKRIVEEEGWEVVDDEAETEFG